MSPFLTSEQAIAIGKRLRLGINSASEENNLRAHRAAMTQAIGLLAQASKSKCNDKQFANYCVTVIRTYLSMETQLFLDNKGSFIDYLENNDTTLKASILNAAKILKDKDYV